MKYQGVNSNIQVIARGLLVHGDEIILCRTKDADLYFLPGGHVEDGESARATLLRELHEEIGDNEYTIGSFIGVCENIFPLEKGILQHEINFVFEVNVPENVVIASKESHIEFENVPRNQLSNYDISPTTLKDGLLSWINDNEPFLKEI